MIVLLALICGVVTAIFVCCCFPMVQCLLGQQNAPRTRINHQNVKDQSDPSRGATPNTESAASCNNTEGAVTIEMKESKCSKGGPDAALEIKSYPTIEGTLPIQMIESKSTSHVGRGAGSGHETFHDMDEHTLSKATREKRNELKQHSEEHEYAPLQNIIMRWCVACSIIGVALLCILSLASADVNEIISQCLKSIYTQLSGKQVECLTSVAIVLPFVGMLALLLLCFIFLCLSQPRRNECPQQSKLDSTFMQFDDVEVSTETAEETKAEVTLPHPSVYGIAPSHLIDAKTPCS